MNAQELRIGNLINYEDENMDIAPRNITSGDILNIDRSCYERLYYDPILITEDWLLKFGFEKSRYECYVKGDYSFKDNMFFFDYDQDESLKISQCEIKYVHQLQNLFYALTGHELKILQPA